MQKFLLFNYTLITLLFFLGSILPCFGQAVKIVDGTNHAPIPNVTVSSEIEERFRISDEAGIVDLSIFSDALLLEFRHPSYQTLSSTKKSILKNGSELLLSQKVIHIDEVVISANKWEQNREEIPHEILVVSPEEAVYNNPQTSADLLESTGKVFVQKSQLGGGSPMIRGFGANAVLIVVDGVRMNNAIFRGGNLQNVINIDPNMLEGAEVISGPGSVIYGSDALGGVMDFHTKEVQLDAPQKFTGNVFFRYASANGERTGHVDWSLSGSKLGWFGGITLSKYGDLRGGANRPEKYPELGLRPYYVERISGQDEIITNPDPIVQTPGGFDQLNTVQKLKWKLHSNLSMEYILNLSTTSDVPRYDRLIEEENGIPVNAEWYYGPQFWMMNAFKLKSKATRYWDELSLTVASQKFQESRHDRKFQEVERRSRKEGVNVFTFNLDANKIWERHELFYGLEFDYNKVKSTAFRQNIENGETEPASTRYPDGGSNMQTYAFYANSKWNLWPSPIYINGGLRFNINILHAVTTDEAFPFDEFNNENEALVGSLGIVWNPVSSFRFSLLGSTGFRSPNVDDMAKVFDSEPGSVMVPNPHLKPEYSYNAEAGFHWQPIHNLSIDLNVFHSWLRDAMVRSDFTFNGSDSILYDGEMSKVQALTNTGKAVVFGLNANVDFTFADYWGITSYVNVMRGEDLISSKSLRHVTPLYGKTSVYFRKEKLRLEIFSRYNGAIPFDKLPPSEQSKTNMYTDDGSLSWFTLNTRASYGFSKKVSLHMALENILDQQYRTYSSGISAPGINFVVSLRASF